MASEITQFASLLHRQGPNSRAVKEFKQNHNDPVFLKRARVIECLYANRREIAAILTDKAAGTGQDPGVESLVAAASVRHGRAAHSV